MIELRSYQNDAVENLRASIGGGNKRLILQAATGAGLPH
jgi:superfamily II DNA or RNA helicase